MLKKKEQQASQQRVICQKREKTILETHLPEKNSQKQNATPINYACQRLTKQRQACTKKVYDPNQSLSQVDRLNKSRRTV